MDVLALLKSASLLVPEETAGENDLTVDDVWEYLAHDEWEVALGLLEELGDVRPLPAAFWASMAAAAKELRLERSAAWCHWREGETRHGVIRADLTLCAPSDGGRRPPVARPRRRRPAPDVGHRPPHPHRRTGVRRRPALGGGRPRPGTRGQRPGASGAAHP
ncbi:hypothetical protein [Streptomyces althioticus]|uniref:hypothetical protein n=1 Tax=Streptomyces althioticus TaxID=83380 RepID=UPI00378B8790